NTPTIMYRMLPLLVILSTIALFLGLARTSEMVVIRAAGRSALRTLMAPVVTTVLFGALAVAAFNPIVAATSEQYAEISRQYQQDPQSVTTVGDEGLWIRQGSAGGQIVIRAKRSNPDGTRFFGVQFYGFNGDGDAIYRIEADEALLQPGYWILTTAKRWNFASGSNPEQAAIRQAEMTVPSDLTRDQIRDSFGSPSSIPIWELPGFIEKLDRAGFSALKHRVWLQMELANPLMMVAMVLIGAGFTMRHTRFGRTGLMVLFAVLLGFSIFFLRNFAQVLGENGQIPVALAAWMPPLAGIFLSLGLLFHTEDG
ncbi:MAG: LPS export ABC transporter permease LptG, partial [Litoreibacter sp.]|nr:LPS export ABC transporter permease LptG [Litoreibacter sp.]